MIKNILSEKDLDKIRGHFMGGKAYKVEREYLPWGYTLTVTVREASDEQWGQKMIIHTESQVGCHYRSQYHKDLASITKFIAEDNEFMKAMKQRKEGAASA